MKKQSNLNLISTFCFSILLMATLSALISCGGGSSGTGSEVFVGTLRTTGQEPIPGATVTILETGDSSTTSADGFYQIETNAPVGNATYLFEGAGFSVTVVIQGVVSENSIISVDFEVDVAGESIEPVRIEIEVEDDDNDDDDNSGSSSSSSSSGDDDDGDDSSSSSSSSSSGDDDDDSSLSSSSSSSDDDSDDEDDSDNSGPGSR